MTVIHDPDNTDKIDTIYAYMSIDDQGRNGIVASILEPIGAISLISGNRDIAEKMKPLAEVAAKMTDKRVGLFAFERKAGEPLWVSG